jgi:hypothetical protein
MVNDAWTNFPAYHTSAGFTHQLMPEDAPAFLGELHVLTAARRDPQTH